MTKRLVLASNNAGKLKEFSYLFDHHFADRQISVVPQAELGVDDADETGLSFIENAIIKARHAAAVTGLPALSDDSGIEIDALNGAPGIRSARYSGQGDRANIDKVLAEMTDVPKAQRQARFQCCLVYMRHAEDPTPQIFQGHWEGQILTSITGEGGFGYDPIFYVPGEDCSAAQLSRERKNQISHRAVAIQQFIQRWCG